MLILQRVNIFFLSEGKIVILDKSSTVYLMVVIVQSSYRSNIVTYHEVWDATQHQCILHGAYVRVTIGWHYHLES
jgi:hypothetical protein